MSPRSRLRSLFGRHKDESEASSDNANSPSSLRYEGASQGRAPQVGQRPMSSSDIPDKTSPARSRSRLRKQSVDRRSHAGIIGTGTGRTSVDSKRKSLDRHANPTTDGTIPSVPDLPNTAKDETFSQSVLQQFPEDSDNTMTAKQQARKSSHAMNFESASSQPVSDRGGRYSEDVADWNIMKSNKPGVSEDVPPPLNVSKTNGERRPRSSSSSSSDYAESAARRGSVSRKPVGSALDRDAKEIDPKRHSVSSMKQKNRASVDKPLPVPPIPSGVDDVAASRHLPSNKDYLVKDAAVAPTLEGVVDLKNTEDTRVTEKWAPAVTHETVNRDIHHIREEVVYREIHTHDVYHRILPIIDIEVLPARHFVPAGDGNLIEISESEIPGRSKYNQEWFVAETLSRLAANSKPITEPRRFTAIDFPGTAGDYKEYVSEKGIPTKETTWVHPPVIEDYGRLTGQTQPFYFGSEDPRDDGLRIRAPHGRVIGTSKIFAEEQARPMTPPAESMKDLSLHDYLSGVPSADLTGKEELTPYEKNKRIGHA